MQTITHAIPRALALAAAAALTVALAACGPSMPTDTPGIRGTITTLAPTDDGVSLLVEGGTQPAGAVSDKAQVAVDADTDLFAEDGSTLSGVDELAEGDEVRVWFEGPVAESYPVQGRAGALQLLGP